MSDPNQIFLSEVEANMTCNILRFIY